MGGWLDELNVLRDHLRDLVDAKMTGAMRAIGEGVAKMHRKVLADVGADRVVWYRPGTDVPYGYEWVDGKRRPTTVPRPSVEVVRAVGQRVLFAEGGRARVDHAYELWVGGAKVTNAVGSRRDACRAAHEAYQIACRGGGPAPLYLNPHAPRRLRKKALRDHQRDARDRRGRNREARKAWAHPGRRAAVYGVAST